MHACIHRYENDKNGDNDDDDDDDGDALALFLLPNECADEHLWRR